MAGLSSPDGLALSPEGILYVVEEAAGRVSRITGDSSVSVLTGLACPEGLAFDSDGNMYVTEDAAGGRVLMLSASGDVAILAEGLDAPEGVVALEPGSILITESTFQITRNPLEFVTGITAIEHGEAPKSLIRLRFVCSFSGIAIDSSGTVYVCNEASGIGTDWSVLALDPRTGFIEPFCTGLSACEGLAFHPGGLFPLFVAEEDTGSGGGRLSILSSDGHASVFATGFQTIEDVTVSSDGYIYVSEDASGMVIVLVPE
jgi:sugar lactone lactonase YvrE